MPRRTYAEARLALDRVPFRNDLERREFTSYVERSEAAVIAEVRTAVTETINELRTSIEAVEDRYAEQDRLAEQVKADIASGRVTAKDAGARVDSIRRELERLEPIEGSLRVAHDLAQQRYEDPIGFRDEMLARFPALTKPDWPF